MTEDPIEIFEQCDTSIVSDAMDDHGLDGVVTGLDAVAPGHAAVGRARPIRFETARAEGLTNFPYEMLDAIVEDEVFVLDGIGPDVSCWGGQASKLAANSGMAGVVIDGGFRDVPDIHKGSFPVFGCQPTPKSGQGRMRVESTDAPVTVDGIRVDVGDVVVADATGVVIVPTEHEDVVAESAADILADEGDLSEMINERKGIEEIRAEHDTF